MKRSHLAILVVGGLSLPLLVYAQFVGPSTAPPNGNVPGVIWNAKGGGVQQNAEINIDGRALVGSPAVKNQIFGDILFSNGNALHIDQNSPSTYYMGNWGGAGGTQKPLTFNINGDLQVSDLGLPPAQGNRGRVQATEFCFNPGGSTDCISSWNNGNFVLKTGDTMTGALNIGVDPGSGATALTVTGDAYGIQAHSGGSGSTALYAINDNNGSYATLGNGGGLTAYGPWVGAYASNGQSASAYLALFGYSFYGQGDFTNSGNATIGGSLYASNHKWSAAGNCTWVSVPSGGWSFPPPGGAGYFCPDGKYMAGMSKSTTNVVNGLYCCNL